MREVWGVEPAAVQQLYRQVVLCWFLWVLFCVTAVNPEKAQLIPPPVFSS